MRRVAPLLAAFALTGCLRWKTDLLVMPDGSGKITVAVSIDETVARLPAPDLRTLARDASGLVAFTKPVVTVEGGWRTIAFTAYFDDVNAVRLPQQCSARPFSWTKSGDGWVLDFEDSVVPGDLGDLRGGRELPDERRKALEERWPSVRGASFSRRVILPGPVTSNEGVEKKDGCTATDAADESHVKSLDAALKSGVLRHARRRIACGASILSEEEIAAFRKEMEAAKTAWPKLATELGAGAPGVEPMLRPRAPKAKDARKRIACLDFADRTGNARGKLGEGAAEIATTYLVKSEQFRVLERAALAKVRDELKLAGADAGVAGTVGKTAGADYVVYGAITNFGMRALGGTPKRYEAVVTIDWRVVDVATSEIVHADSADGSAEQAGGAFDETLAARALRAAVVKKIDDLIDAVEKKR